MWNTNFKVWFCSPTQFSSYLIYERMIRTFIGKFVVVYFDDILVYSKSLHEHVDHVKQVLLALRDAFLFSNLKKCTICIDKLVFLGMWFLPKGLKLTTLRLRQSQIGHRQLILLNLVAPLVCLGFTDAL